MTRYVIYDTRTNQKIVGSAEMRNAVKLLNKLTEKYGRHYVIRKEKE